MSTDRQASTIVSAVISLGHSLGLDVIAEGVETEGELAALTAMGCDQAQGFVFSQALSASAMQATLSIAGMAQRATSRLTKEPLFVMPPPGGLHGRVN
jgi:EAL domain-containing protein (putative c-di-GMP-specific phosphodiesterase class I)